MIEFKKNGPFHHGQSEEPDRVVRIVGIGGAGTNIIDRIILDSHGGENVACMDTDQQAHAASVASHRFLLGKTLLRGMGTGGDPELCATLVDDEHDVIHQAFDGATIAVLVCGLGGGTGTGLTPALLDTLREMDIRTVVVGLTPLLSEGRRRMNLARETAQVLRKKADAVLLFSNERILHSPEAKEDVRTGLSQANQCVAQIVHGLAQLLRMQDVGEMGGDHLLSLLGRYVSRSGEIENAWCGVGAWTQEGADREAIYEALESPLLSDGLGWRKADRLIAFVEGSSSMPVSEYQRLMEQLRKALPVELHVHCGVAINPAMQDRLQLHLLAIWSGEDEVVVDDPPAPAQSSKEIPTLSSPSDGVYAQSNMDSVIPSEEGDGPRITRKNARRQKHFEEQVELPFDAKALRGRFEKSDPTIHHNGENLDQPTFIRLGIKIRL